MSAIVSPVREPLITGSKTYHQITEDICAPTEKMPNLTWVIAFVSSIVLLAWGMFCILWTIWFGIGSWNLNRTIGWGWDITNFVWWIGIGHAGTLISAILLLFRQKWRTGVNRAAEAMTIFAVMCAALFPGIHVGRIWLVFYFFPSFFLIVKGGKFARSKNEEKTKENGNEEDSKTLCYRTNNKELY